MKSERDPLKDMKRKFLEQLKQEADNIKKKSGNDAKAKAFALRKPILAWTPEIALEWALSAVKDLEGDVYSASDVRTATTIAKAMNVYQTYLICEQERCGTLETETEGEPFQWSPRTVKRLFMSDHHSIFPRVKEKK